MCLSLFPLYLSLELPLFSLISKLTINPAYYTELQSTYTICTQCLLQWIIYLMCFNVKFAWFSLGNVSFFRISTHELQDVSISFLTTMWTVFRRCILGFFKHSDYCMIAVFVHHSICMLDIFQGIASFYSAIDLMQHKIAFSFSLYGGFFFYFNF